MKHDGFTLIEFIVIMSIFAIMASVALFNFQGFRSNVAVNNLAQDIALLARQAQTFGWSTLSEDSAGQILLSGGTTGNPLRFSHGIFFDYDTTGFRNTITLYKKNNTNPGDEYYIPNSQDILVDQIVIQGSYQIVAVASAANKNDLLLTATNEIPQIIPIVNDVSIAFSRPKPEALIFENSTPVNQNYLGIYIGPTNQTTIANTLVIISRSGEIWVE